MFFVLRKGELTLVGGALLSMFSLLLISASKSKTYQGLHFRFAIRRLLSN
jgi:hypothetical protein